MNSLGFLIGAWMFRIPHGRILRNEGGSDQPSQEYKLSESEQTKENIRLTDRLWEIVASQDLQGLASLLHDDGEYTDVGTPKTTWQSAEHRSRQGSGSPSTE